MSDEFDLYDALRDACYRAADAGTPKRAIIKDLEDIIAFVREEDSEFPEEAA